VSAGLSTGGASTGAAPAGAAVGSAVDGLSLAPGLGTAAPGAASVFVPAVPLSLLRLNNALILSIAGEEVVGYLCVLEKR